MAEDRESVGCMRNRQCIRWWRRRESGAIGCTNMWFVAKARVTRSKRTSALLESCGSKLGYTRKHNKAGQQRRFCSNEVLKTEFTANIAAHGKQTTSTGKDYTQDFPSRSKRNLLPLFTVAHLEFDAMGQKEIKNVLELIVCRASFFAAAKNEARRQSRLRGSELIAMRLRQPERFA